MGSSLHLRTYTGPAARPDLMVTFMKRCNLIYQPRFITRYAWRAWPVV
jgi:hypothetical protein